MTYTNRPFEQSGEVRACRLGEFGDGDFRSTVPRFSEENRKANQALVDLLQIWVMPLFKASGRFSAGFGTVPVEDSCRE